jgi:hypothetical protein
MIALVAAALIAAAPVDTAHAIFRFTFPTQDDSSTDYRTHRYVPGLGDTVIAHWRILPLVNGYFDVTLEDSVAGRRGEHGWIPRPAGQDTVRWQLVTTWITKPFVLTRNGVPIAIYRGGPGRFRSALRKNR